MSSVRYGIRLGDLKENWFLFFPIKHSTHTRSVAGQNCAPGRGLSKAPGFEPFGTGHYGPRKVGKWALVAVFARFRADFATKPFSILDGSPILFVTTIPTSEAHRKLRFAPLFFFGFFFSQRTLFVH